MAAGVPAEAAADLVAGVVVGEELPVVVVGAVLGAVVARVAVAPHDDVRDLRAGRRLEDPVRERQPRGAQTVLRRAVDGEPAVAGGVELVVRPGIGAERGLLRHPRAVHATPARGAAHGDVVGTGVRRRCGDQERCGRGERCETHGALAIPAVHVRHAPTQRPSDSYKPADQSGVVDRATPRHIRWALAVLTLWVLFDLGLTIAGLQFQLESWIYDLM